MLMGHGVGQVDESIPPLQPGYVRTIVGGVVVDTPIGPHGTSQIVDTPDTSSTGAGTGVQPGQSASGAGGGGGSPGTVLFPGSSDGTGLGPFPNIFGIHLPINVPNFLLNPCQNLLGNGSVAQSICPYAGWILLAVVVLAVLPKGGTR